MYFMVSAPSVYTSRTILHESKTVVKKAQAKVARKILFSLP